MHFLTWYKLSFSASLSSLLLLLWLWLKFFCIFTCDLSHVDRVVFIWVSKVICVCFGFVCITTLSDWSKNLAPLSQPIKTETKTNRLSRARFHAFCTSYMYSLCVLIGSLDCLWPLWLVRVITLFLVLRHSIENCSFLRQGETANRKCQLLCRFKDFTVKSSCFLWFCTLALR